MPEGVVLYCHFVPPKGVEHAAMIALQPELRPSFSTVYGPKDYRDFRDLLMEMDRILLTTGVEANFVARHISSNPLLSKRRTPQAAAIAVTKALRHSILLGVTCLSHRELAIRVADSELLQWFTGTTRIDGARPVSKSTIERFEKMFPDGEVTELIHDLTRCCADAKAAEEVLMRETALRLDRIFADTTCVKANIHFPVDWVLLRDAVRTLVKAIGVIRSHGIRYRIGDPAGFLRRMNKMCIEMTHLRKKPDAPKKRKVVLRRMKKLTKTVERQAWNYHRELTARWKQTDLSEAEAQVILNRMEEVLDQLPEAVARAHERIIGGRKVKNRDKILSLHEPDIHVLVRGKSGAEVEFGNGLYLAEQDDGLIVDWLIIKEQPPGDGKLVFGSIERLTAEYGKPASYATDRGFDSSDNRLDLERLGTFNAICPRSVPLFEERLKDEFFCLLQKRRGGTEARIAIFKNAYLGKPLRSKGFKNRRTRIEWCVLAHNLCKLAEMAMEGRRRLLESKSA